MLHVEEYTNRCPLAGSRRKKPVHPDLSVREQQDAAIVVDGKRGHSAGAYRFNLLRSLPFRLMMGMSAVYVICFGIAACIFYGLLMERMASRIDGTISARYESINAVYERYGIDRVIELAHEQSQLPMSDSLGFHLATPDGDRVAGNVPICITEPGWDDLTGADLGLDDNGSYRFFTAQLGNNLLSLGKSNEALGELRSMALNSFISASVISLFLGLLAASYFAYRTHCRIQTIARSLSRVASGKLDARLPLSSRGDDIDSFAEQINDALSRLEQMVNSVRQVSNDIAHDLKTPLNRLYIQIEEAAELTRQGEQVDQQLMLALDEARDINGTFEALLRISQIEAGARRAQFRSIELSGVLETVAEVYSAVVEENDQTLECRNLTDRALPMFGDRELITQLAVNLIENAIRHCPAGASIVLDSGESPEGVWFSVSDNGPGIPEAERGNVLRRLYRLESSRTTEGTGLGLSLVKAVADLHCGVLTLEDSEPGLRVNVAFARDCPTC